MKDFRKTFERVSSYPTRMTIILHGISGLQFWRSTHVESLRCSRSRINMPASPSVDIAGIDFAQYGITLPVHLIVSNQGDRRPSASVICHSMERSKADNSFVRIEKGITVVSPELCFAQMARQLPFLKTVELGFEFCGSYVLDESPLQAPMDDSDKYWRRQLTTLDSLERFIEEKEGMPGIRVARIAIAYIVENSASPMETICVMLLCLPTCYGGYGLPFPVLNWKNRMGTTKQRWAGKSHYKFDMYWPNSNLVVEYDSNEKHTGGARIGKDAIRRDIVSTMRDSFIVITKSQIRNTAAFDAVAHIIAGKLGYRIRTERGDIAQRRAALRGLLLGTDTWRF